MRIRDFSCNMTSWQILLCLVLEIHSILAIPESDEFEMRREKLKKGFHREIRTEVTWRVHSGPGKGDTEEDCAFLLEETIPPGMYADMDQLRSLHQRGHPLVLSDKAINIEASAHLSPSHTLHVFLPIVRRPASKSSVSLAVTVPLHLRYHLPSTDDDVTHVVVSLPSPALYTNCSVAGSFPKKLPCGMEAGMCTWWKVSFLGDVQSLEFEVPVGNLKHYTFVLVGTLVVVILGCVAVCFATPGKNTRPDTSHKTKSKTKSKTR